jgi:copper chaperone
MRSLFVVNGVTRGADIATVSDAMRELHGVVDVLVDLQSGEVTVDSGGPLDRAEVRAAVGKAGYSLDEVSPGQPPLDH